MGIATRAVVEDFGGGREYSSGGVELIMREGKRSGFDDITHILWDDEAYSWPIWVTGIEAFLLSIKGVDLDKSVIFIEVAVDGPGYKVLDLIGIKVSEYDGIASEDRVFPGPVVEGNPKANSSIVHLWLKILD